MNLPAFDSLGNLPEAIYCCELHDLHEYFVKPFANSVERLKIYDSFCLLHDQLEKIGVNATQWIDGSFTTRKLDPSDMSQELEPSDIDVVTFIDYAALNAMPPIAQAFLKSLVSAGEATKYKYRAHTFGFASCTPSHPYYPEFEKARRHFRDAFSRHSPPSTRKPDSLSIPYPVNGPRKGIIEITVGNPALAPKINRARI